MPYGTDMPFPSSYHLLPAPTADQSALKGAAPEGDRESIPVAAPESAPKSALVENEGARKAALVVNGSHPEIVHKKARYHDRKGLSISKAMTPNAPVFIPQAYATGQRSEATTKPSRLLDAAGPRIPSTPTKRGDHHFARPTGESVIHAPPYDNLKSPNPFLDWSPLGHGRQEKKTPTAFTGFYLGTTMVGETAALSGGEAMVWAIIHSDRLMYIPRPKDEHPIIGMWGSRPIPEKPDFETCLFKNIRLDVHLAGIQEKTLISLCMSVLKQPYGKNGFLFKFT